jgi:hypothetical protein
MPIVPVGDQSLALGTGCLFASPACFHDLESGLVMAVKLRGFLAKLWRFLNQIARDNAVVGNQVEKPKDFSVEVEVTGIDG